MEIGTWNLPLTPVVSPLSSGERRNCQANYDANLVSERINYGLIPACRSVVLATQTAPREDAAVSEFQSKKGELPATKTSAGKMGAERFLLLRASFVFPGAP
jgi:hypothetical protein